MSSHSDFQLFWYDVHPNPIIRHANTTCSPARKASGDHQNSDSVGDVEICPGSPRFDQFVFTTQADMPFSLQRVQSVQDFLELLSGEKHSGEKLAVSLLALLGGNLVATGQLTSLIVLSFAWLLTAFLEIRCGVAAMMIVMSLLFANSLWKGVVSLHWLLTVSVVLLLTLITLNIVVHLVREDPRSYVLLKHDPEDSTKDLRAVSIRNDCCMDVKLLVFDGTDFVRWVPHGGMLGGHLLRRGGSHPVGPRPPYMVKFYAPWERELGTFLVEDGAYSFRATAPPLFVVPSEQQTFSNHTEAFVHICVCDEQSWTSSLWLPLAPFLARLTWPATRVAPEAEVPISAPCLLRVFEGIAECACCVVRNNESVQYHGIVNWTPVRPRSMQSRSSSFVRAVH